MITAAAMKIRVPSTAADMYSALPCPKSWLWSAGLADSRSAHSATRAATRFTIDSMASDHSPTELETYAATPLIVTVATAVAMDSQMNRSSRRWFALGSTWEPAGWGTVCTLVSLPGA
jgi:hypothetical protein